MSASQRRKGQAGELEAYRVLHERLGDVVGKRELGQTRDGGLDIPIDAMIKILVDAKRQERARLCQWIDKALHDAERDGALAAVMWRPNRGRWIVAMDIEDWCELVRESL